jgi:glycosyltransferase involved in cell wall biosynthesis
VYQNKLLLVSCYFPPAGGIGVQRALSLARYLPQNGFEVFVLTARASVPTVDAGLLNLIPEEVHVHRTWTLEPPFHFRKKLWSGFKASNGSHNGGNGFTSGVKSIVSRKIKRIVCPDPQVLWYPFAIRRASKLIREDGIKTVVVTAPPFSGFLILNELKRRFPHLCLIADMRDEWLQYYLKEFGFRGDKYIAARAAEIERETVESCDRVVCVTATSLNEIRSRYPAQPDSKFVLVPNGYDPAVFSEFRPRSNNTRKLVVTYAGTVYKPCSPRAYLDALDGLPQIRQEFETHFVGRISEEFDRKMFENRPSFLRFTGFVPQTEAVRAMEESDVLLLPWTDRFNIPGKVFEYLVTGKPILAICYPDSEVGRVIRETSSGWCVSPDDAEAIRRALTEIHAMAGKYPHDRNWEAIRRYERPRLAAEYGRVIREAIRLGGSVNSMPKELASC